MLSKSYIKRNVIVKDSHWVWNLCKIRGGYGQASQRVGNSVKKMSAHRLSYELFNGPIPNGMHVDHLCRIRQCVNPEHLEAVTPKENIKRGLTGVGPKPWLKKDVCINGHTYTLENTYIKKNGSKNCKKCRANAVIKFKLNRRQYAS